MEIEEADIEPMENTDEAKNIVCGAEVVWQHHCTKNCIDPVFANHFVFDELA